MKKTSFTLIELPVVIAILAAMLLPALGRARDVPYIALRHSDQFNYLTKSGAVFSTKSGVSGLGLQPVWHYDQSTGKYWRDGVYRTE